MSSRVYLAGSSAEVTRVQRWARALDGAGVEISDRWFDGAELWAGQDAFVSREAQASISIEHLRAIHASRVFWLLCPRSMSGGSMVELGTALAIAEYVHPLAIVVTGIGSSRSIFTGAANYRDESDACGLVEVVRLLQEAAQ